MHHMCDSGGSRAREHHSIRRWLLSFWTSELHLLLKSVDWILSSHNPESKVTMGYAGQKSPSQGGDQKYWSKHSNMVSPLSTKGRQQKAALCQKMLPRTQPDGTQSDTFSVLKRNEEWWKKERENKEERRKNENIQPHWKDIQKQNVDNWKSRGGWAFYSVPSIFNMCLEFSLPRKDVKPCISWCDITWWEGHFTSVIPPKPISLQMQNKDVELANRNFKLPE